MLFKRRTLPNAFPRAFNRILRLIEEEEERIDLAKEAKLKCVILELTGMCLLSRP